MASKWLWRVAVLCFLVALAIMVAQPAWAQAEAGGVTFSWAQVVVLVGMAAAWGDMRRQVADLRRDVDAVIEVRAKKG